MKLTIQLSKEVADLAEAQSIVSQVKAWLETHPGFDGYANLSHDLTNEMSDSS